jgi:type III secretory pathway component EscT
MLHLLKNLDEYIFMAVVVDMVMAVVMAMDVVEVVITLLHRTTRSKRSIILKEMIKEKMFMIILSEILKSLVLDAVPKGTGLKFVEHQSTFVSSIRNL